VSNVDADVFNRSHSEHNDVGTPLYSTPSPTPCHAVRQTPPKRKPINRQRTQRRHWAPEEEERFLKALERFGPKDSNDVIDPVSGRVSVHLEAGASEMIAILVGTRSSAQVRSHVQKYYIRLHREDTRRKDRKSEEVAKLVFLRA
jgi:hypothetical protein